MQSSLDASNLGLDPTEQIEYRILRGVVVDHKTATEHFSQSSRIGEDMATYTLIICKALVIAVLYD